MAQALTLHLSDHDAEEVRRIAHREHRSVSAVGARIVDEWLRLNRFPLIEFRSIGDDRVACLKGRLEVWQVIFIALGYADNVLETAQHLNLTQEQVQAALDYASSYPEEIQQALQENAGGYERLARMLPQIQKTTITEDDWEEPPVVNRNVTEPAVG